jgi:EAL domain-containing protein (putative c-di-GMP-specific phosphodiesterase class I)
VPVVAGGEGISEGVAECTVVVGPMGDVRSAGGQTDEVLGVAARELAGSHLRDLLSRPDRGRLFDLMREALAGAPPALGNHLGSGRGGSNAVVSVVPMEANGDGHVESWVLRFALAARPPAIIGPRPPAVEDDLRPEDLSPAAIERALRDERFGLDLQPVIDLETGEPAECEALVRWLTPGGDRLPAGGFIEAIEKAGLMSRLTDYVLERSLDQLSDWSGELGSRRITVNVAAADLVQKNFADRVEKLVANAGVDPSRLVLEFGHDLLKVDLDTLERIFADLRNGAGVRLGIDQSTARRSPLTAFCLGVDAVKLDPSASLHAAGSTIDASILAMFTDLCRTSGIDVIGTGIEVQEQLDALQRAGCSHGQGYLLGRPSPSTAVHAASKPVRSARSGINLVPRPDQLVSVPDLQRAIDHWRREVDTSA